MLGVSDYSIYVRNPIDLSIIKDRLEKCAYNTYFEFVQEVRLVFKNAQNYNKVHLAKDTTGISKEIYDKALSCEEMLDDVLYSTFSIDVSDKWSKIEIAENESLSKKLKEEAIENNLKAEAALHYEQLEAEMKRSDLKFAADLDVQSKRKETKRLLREQREDEGILETAIEEALEKLQTKNSTLTEANAEKIFFGVITSSKDIDFAKGNAVSSPASFFPVSDMIIPEPIKVASGIDNSMNTYQTIVNVPNPDPAFTYLRPIYTRTQELFLKYQIQRHQVRKRARECFNEENPIAKNTLEQASVIDVSPTVGTKNSELNEKLVVDVASSKFEAVDAAPTASLLGTLNFSINVKLPGRFKPTVEIMEMDQNEN